MANEKVSDVEVKETSATNIKPGTPVVSTASKVGSAPTVQEVQKAVEVKSQVNYGFSASKELIGLFDRVKNTKNDILINAIESIKDYMVKMAPGCIVTEKEGAQYQVVLFRAIRTIIEYSGNDFQLGFVTLLRMFDENSKGVFHEMYVFRFTDIISLSYDDRRAFERIINLIKIAAPVQGRREAIKQVNMLRTMQYSFTDNGRNNISHFFDR